MKMIKHIRFKRSQSRRAAFQLFLSLFVRFHRNITLLPDILQKGGGQDHPCIAPIQRVAADVAVVVAIGATG